MNTDKMNEMNTDNSLLAFKAITSFITDLHNAYKPPKSLKLYKRLVDAVKVVHTESILKHNNIFKTFCDINREAIQTRNHSKFVSFKISYNDNIYLDLSDVIKKSNNDQDCIDAIFAHLLTISAILFPEGDSKKVLQSLPQMEKSPENDFLGNIMRNVEGVAGKNKDMNPMDAITQMMSSGMMTDMMSSLASGQLDMKKIMSSVKNMINTIDTSDSNTGEAVDMLRNVVDSLESGKKPDLKNMIETVSKLQNIDDEKDKQNNGGGERSSAGDESNGDRSNINNKKKD